MDKIIFILLAIFPFGQLFKIDRFLIFDGVVLLSALYSIFLKLPKPKFFKYVEAFLLVTVFSYILFFALNLGQNMTTGFLYLIRLLAYSYFFVFAYNLKNKKKYLNYLLSISVVSAVLGWIQYFVWPNLIFLKEFNWDDHLLRMTGTFLDPTFLALILVLGVIVALYQKKYLFFAFLSLSIIFTYSRVSYLLLFLVILFDLLRNKNIKRYLLLNLVFIFLLFIPKNIGEGTTFTRTASTYAKLENYTKTLHIIKKYPLFGVGYNNICLAKNLYVEYTPTDSHSCSGSDSSLLFVLATTGIAGFMSFIYMVFKILTSMDKKNRYIVYTSGVVVFIHSLFANSLFYPFIMFYLIILSVVSLKE